MVWKILTATQEIEARDTAIQTAVAVQTMQTTQTMLTLQETQKTITETTALRFLNVQRLMAYMKAFEAVRLIPLLPPTEHLKRITTIETPLLKEEEYVIKGILPQSILERERTVRREQVRLEKRLAEVRQRLLSPTAITLTDHEELCLLEKYLWTTLQADVKQCLEKLLYMTIAKQTWCETITGLEALQKLLLQMYIPMYAEMPQTMNMLSLRLTALTRQILFGLNACIYMQSTEQAQMMKSKALLMCAQKRKLITKAVSSGKTKKQYVPRKEEVGTTEELTDETEISTGKDAFGKDMFYTMLRYAYTMPYWMRKWLARSYGMPENHKYARYFGIGCVPIRRGLWGWRRRRYSPESWTNFNRDEYIKLIKKYGSRYRTEYPLRAKI